MLRVRGDRTLHRAGGMMECGTARPGGRTCEAEDHRDRPGALHGGGSCIPDCPEGALQPIDGKARPVSDLFCDGLGACVGTYPEGAIDVVEREAEPYDERAEMATIAPRGEAVVREHPERLLSHGEVGLRDEAIEYLRERAGKRVPVMEGTIMIGGDLEPGGGAQSAGMVK
jgi:ferredoxin